MLPTSYYLALLIFKVRLIHHRKVRIPLIPGTLVQVLIIPHQLSAEIGIGLQLALIFILLHLDIIWPLRGGVAANFFYRSLLIKATRLRRLIG